MFGKAIVRSLLVAVLVCCATTLLVAEVVLPSDLLPQASGAEKVILFGSYARGEARDTSDVDLMIVAESGLPRFKRSRALYGLLRPYPFSMDLIVYTPAEVEQGKLSPLSFVSTVLREGKTVYVRGT